jgi:hypothetical protein
MFKFKLYLTLKKCKGNIRIILMNIRKNNPVSRSKTKFDFDNISKQQGH